MNPQNKIFTLPFLILLLNLIFVCSKKESGDIQISEENGITFISNPAQPIYPDAKLIYEEELCIGQEEGDTNYIFYRVGGIQADEEGAEIE